MAMKYKTGDVIVWIADKSNELYRIGKVKRNEYELIFIDSDREHNTGFHPKKWTEEGSIFQTPLQALL